MNPISLKRVILIPTDSAAMRLSRIACIARPVRESTRNVTTTKVNKSSTIPTHDPLCPVDDHLPALFERSRIILHKRNVEPLCVFSEVKYIQQTLNDLAECQRHDGKIIPVQPQYRNPDQKASQCSGQRAQQKRDQKADRNRRNALQRRVCKARADKSAHRHKARMPQGQLAQKPYTQIQAHGNDRIDAQLC